MPTAIVVGGGLAGMVIAGELASRQWRVTLLERSPRLGGKAGSDLQNGRHVEHGYHVFPQWYPNVRAILARIGVSLIDFDRYYFVRLGEYPRLITVRGLSGPRAVLHSIFRGLLPWYHNVLYFYSVIDMLSRLLSETRLLDHVSHIGLMRGKWYVSESVAELHQENMLKATAIPAYDISAMTVERFLGYWVRQGDPFLSVLPGDLQEAFIEPQVRELEALGVDIRHGAEVTGVRIQDGAVASVRLRDESEVTGDVFVLCTPFEVTRQWVKDELYTLDPALGHMHLLEAQPMAALHLHLRHRIPHLPRVQSQARNLYLAGDFVKNGIDLACMEGAVSAALEAACKILGDYGETGGLPVPRMPPVWPRGLMVAARLGFAPVVALVHTIAWVEETLFLRRPDASEVRQRATPRLRQDPRPPRKRHTSSGVNRR
jgi:phytoene dehydrogenase-like protein